MNTINTYSIRSRRISLYWHVLNLPLHTNMKIFEVNKLVENAMYLECKCIFIRQFFMNLIFLLSKNNFKIWLGKSCRRLQFAREMFVSSHVLCIYLWVLNLIVWILFWIVAMDSIIILTLSAVMHHSNSVFYFPHIKELTEDNLMARPWPACWCKRICSQSLAHWLGHLCLQGRMRPAVCLPLKMDAHSGLSTLLIH